MIVVDTSALVAIADGESDRAQYSEVIGGAAERLISAVSVLEFTIILARRIEDAKRSAHDFLEQYSIAIEPVDLVQLSTAQDAFLAYGKGRHPAGLNFGDCFAYALARTRRAPLLFKGDDFAKTDIARAA